MAWAQQAVSNYDRNKYVGQCCCALDGRVDEVVDEVVQAGRSSLISQTELSIKCYDAKFYMLHVPEVPKACLSSSRVE